MRGLIGSQLGFTGDADLSVRGSRLAQFGAHAAIVLAAGNNDDDEDAGCQVRRQRCPTALRWCCSRRCTLY